MSSSEQTPETITAAYELLGAWPEGLSLDTAQGALVAGRLGFLAMHMGDKSAMLLFRAVLACLKHETARLPADVRAELEPLIGHAVRTADDDADEETPEGPWLHGQLQRWAVGEERESAKEWARELGALADKTNGAAARAEEGAMHFSGRGFLIACARDITQCGYAFALGLSLCEQQCAALALYRLVRTAVGMIAQRYRYDGTRGQGDYPIEMRERMLPEIWRTANKSWRGTLLRVWPLVEGDREDVHVTMPLMPGATGRASGMPGSVLASYAASCLAVNKQLGPSDFKKGLAMAMAARARGFFPALGYSVPAKAFDPEPTPEERET